METLKRYLLTFVLVLAGITISSTIFITIFYPDLHNIIALLWQIITLAGVCTLGNLIFYSKKEISKGQMKVRMILHYSYIILINMSAALFFQWISPGFLMGHIVMFVLITVNYFAVMMVNIQRQEKTAENMNRLLRKLHTKEKEEEE